MAEIKVSSESVLSKVESQRNRSQTALARALSLAESLNEMLKGRDAEIDALKKIIVEQGDQLRAAGAELNALKGELAVFKNPPQDASNS
jgi:hypothetical protein